MHSVTYDGLTSNVLSLEEIEHIMFWGFIVTLLNHNCRGCSGCLPENAQICRRRQINASKC